MFTLLILQDIHVCKNQRIFTDVNKAHSLFMVENSIFDNLKFDEYVDWYTDIGYKIYNEKFWTQSHTI